MRDGEPQIYTALATLRNGYMQTQWQRVQMFLVFNTVAFPLVLGSTQSEEVKFFVSLVGMFMHAILLQATLRADNWIKYMDARLVELESLDSSDDNKIRVKVFSNPNFTTKRQSLLASRRSFGFVGLIIAGIWVWQTFRFARMFFH